MALPRRKLSKTRRNKRRNHHKLEAKSLTVCPNPKCGQLIMPHRVCPYCGEYKGAEYHVIVTKK